MKPKKQTPPRPLTEDYRLSNRLRPALVAVAAVIVIALLLLLWLAQDRQHKAEMSAAKLKVANIGVQARNDALTKANEKLIRAGEAPVSLPPGTPGTQGLPGPIGLTGLPGKRGPGPNAAQVSQAVASYCASGVCAGHGPTASQVASAVNTYCNARGQCQGSAGRPGRDGAPGVRGPPGAAATGPQGPAGPGPSDAQVQSAVADYCNAHGNCQGPKGDTGPPGRDGQDAYPFTWTFTVQVNPAQTQTFTCTLTDPSQTAVCQSQ